MAAAIPISSTWTEATKAAATTARPCLKGPDLGHTHCRLEMGGQLRKEKLKNNI